MKRLVFAFLWVILLVSCTKESSCINADLYDCIDKYIGKRGFFTKDDKGKLVPAVDFYYSVYFFEKDAQNYFTIWLGITPAYIYVDYPNNDRYDYSYAVIEDRDVVSIKNKGEHPPLYFDCKDISVLERKRKRQELLVHEYDGPAYPTTFEYYLENGKYQIKKSDEIIFDIWPDYPFEYFERREKERETTD